MKHLLLALLLAATASAACAQPLTERVAKDELAFMADEEPEMRKAFQKARATLEDFLARAKNPAPGTRHYAVKVGIQQGQATEYFWIGPFTQTGDRFSGTIDNTPRVVKTVKEGQTYAFTKRQIVDWTYLDLNERRLQGNYTMCALLTKEPPAEAEEARKRYGLRCD